MTLLIAVVVVLVAFGSILAMAEASITRVSHVHAVGLQEQGRRNADVLVRIESDPPRYLNSLYLTVMLAQNGSAILVAIIADRTFGDLGITLVSVGFTLLYFVLVEAMSKTLGVLQSDRVALFVAPLVAFLAKIFSVPVRLLIGLSNVLLPGKGLRSGPFVTTSEIREMAHAGHESGAIEETERDLIGSVLELGERSVRDVMVPRPDMTIVGADVEAADVLDVMLEKGYSRVPVYDREPENLVGVVYEKDLVKALRGGSSPPVRHITREPYFVPESMPLSALLHELRERRPQMAIVVDEHGDLAGLVTLEDVLEEIVGDIPDEYGEVEPPDIRPVGAGCWLIDARAPIHELNDAIGSQVAEDPRWRTLGGLITAVLGRIPSAGDELDVENLRLRVEEMDGRRIRTVFVRRA